MQSSSLKLTKLNNSTEGETVVFIGPAQRISEYSALLSGVIVYGFTPENPDPKRLLEFSEFFKALVVEDKLTRLTLVGVDWGGPLVIHYVSENIKNVRRVLFIDAISRPKQLRLERAFEWLENFLPLGLPFRPISKDFDPRPIMHRVRCPVLVITEKISDSLELKAHSKFLMDRLPNAWHSNMGAGEFPKIFERFIGVATKQPQKASRG